MSSQINSVPMLDLKRQFKVIGEEMNDALRRVNETGQFVLGPEVKKLEEGIAAYSKIKRAVGCASGSDALLLALMAIKAGEGTKSSLLPLPFSQRRVAFRELEPTSSSPILIRSPFVWIQKTSVRS